MHKKTPHAKASWTDWVLIFLTFIFAFIGPGVLFIRIWRAGGFNFTLTEDEITRFIIGFMGMAFCLILMAIKNRKSKGVVSPPEIGGSTMNIAIIGAGAVAKTFLELLESPDSINVSHIKVKYVFNSSGGVFEKDGIKPFENLSAHESFTPGLGIKDIDLNEIDLVVDLKSTDMQNAEADFETCAWVLGNAKHLVNGNKGPVVYGYKKLKAIADSNGVQFLCGCAAAAALPSVIVGKDAHSGSKIHAFEGIVNGTTNYILSKMEEGIPYDAALKLAQDAGIAEKNPAYDVEGIDTAIKTVMLANIIWDMEIPLENAQVIGIDKLTLDDIKKAVESGMKFKLIGTAILNANGEPEIKIAPTAIPEGHLLYATDQKFKAIVFKSSNMGDVLISGSSSLKGAAAAVLRDVVNIYMGNRNSQQT